MLKKIGMLLFLVIFISGCYKVLPAEDIDIYEYCKDEIAVLKNPKLRTNSREKYEAALKLSKKVDFSYTRTVDFLNKIFLEKDAKVDNPNATQQLIVLYFPYKDNFISFEFHRLHDNILKTVIRVK